jgi:hypothetical protein
MEKDAMTVLNPANVTPKMIESITRIASAMTLAEALEILNRLDKGYMARPIYEDRTDATESSFERLGDDPFNLIMPLNRLPLIWWHGGPPNSQAWIPGLPCQYVADCILNETVVMGEEYVASIMREAIITGAP